MTGLPVEFTPYWIRGGSDELGIIRGSLKRGNGLKLHKDEDLAAVGEISALAMVERISKKGNREVFLYRRRV
jgi:hypothetical protein